MKWIKIDKAKVQSNELYLVIDKMNIPLLGRLVKTDYTNNGPFHTFRATEGDNPREIDDATHIALITLPNEKEVTNG